MHHTFNLCLTIFYFLNQWITSCLETLHREDEEGCKLKVPQLECNNAFCTPTKDDSIAQQTINSILLSPNYDKSFEEVSTLGN